MSKDRHEMEKITENIGPLFDKLTTKLPGLLRAITQTMYNEDTARELGRAVGTFYRELCESGVPQEEALEMTHSYLKSMQSIFRDGVSQRGM